MFNPTKSVTLLELLIAIAIMGLIVLGFSSIDLFSRHHVISSDRRAKLQNEVSYILEHMTKEVNKAVGDAQNQPVFIEDTNRRIRAYIDAATSPDVPDGRRGTGNDHEIAYAYNPTTYQVLFYDPYPAASGEILSQKISSVNFTHTWSDTQRDNYIGATITACWDPANPATCGTPDNPDVTMNTRIKMPLVSVH